MKPHSILFCTGIYPPDIGGPATYTKKMACALANDGFSVSIISYGEKIQHRNEDGVDIFFIRRNFPFHFLSFFWKTLLVGRKVDRIYLQGTFSDGIPTILANIFLKKDITIRIGGVFSWEYSLNNGKTSLAVEEFIRQKQSFYPESLKKIDKWVTQSCNRVIANSQYSKNLLALSGIDKKKIVVIPNSIDPLARKTANANALFSKYNLPKQKKIILFVGRLVRQKNLDLLIDFFSILPTEYILLIIGSGPEKETLGKKREGQEMEERIFFFEPLSRTALSEIYSISSLAVLLSSYEGMSHVLIEYMQFSLPIIASNIEPNREVLKGYPLASFIELDQKSFLHAFNQAILQEGKHMTYPLERYSFKNAYAKLKEALCV